jgi:probable DNA metabolism protein
VLRVDGTLAGWRGIARPLLAAGVPPGEVSFTEEGQLGLLPGGAAPARPPGAGSPPCVPASFLQLAERVACHRDPSRWDRLYRAAWRAARSGAAALEDPSDLDLAALERMAEEVRKDVLRVQALVRFRRLPVEGGDELYLAFHRPQHRSLALASPFFARRYAPMRWSILTPDASAHWDRRALTFGPGVPRGLEVSDGAEALWRAYYASTFTPGRVNQRSLQAHLPRRHWETLPEAREITALVRGSGRGR